MTKFSGFVGYNLGDAEVRPGEWEPNIVERTYSGDVKAPTRLATEVDYSTNRTISVSNSIEIVADEFAANNFFAIKYVNWKGTNWDVESVAARHPRLILRLGGIYNGPTPTPESP